MPYDPFKHHRRSIRLRGYDYSQAGAYFVTICEVNRECIFGEIVNGEMQPNQFGDVVLKWWNGLPAYYPPVELDEFVVMPNHMHGVIVISAVGAGSSRPDTVGRKDVGAGSSRPNTPDRAMEFPGSSRPVSRPNGRQDAAPTEKRTLGQLVGYFKFQITKEINQIRDMGYAKVLQRDYYEHIIRNEREWNAIAEYIRNNPANWNVDLDNPANFAKRPPPNTSEEYWHDAGL